MQSFIFSMSIAIGKKSWAVTAKDIKAIKVL